MPLKPSEPRAYNSPQRNAAAAQTRERIVAAAREQLASADGLRGFSLDAVARAAKVTRLTVYNQFGSRRALLEAVFDDMSARGGLHRLEVALTEAEPLDGLRQLIAVFAAFFTGMRLPMEPLLAAADLKGDERAEVLPVETFLKLARARR